MKRSLFWFSIFFSLGIGAAGVLPASLPMLIALLIVFLIFIYININITHSRKILILFFAFILGAGYFPARLYVYEKTLSGFYDNKVKIEGRVISVHKENGKIGGFDVKTRSISLDNKAIKRPCKITFYITDLKNIEYGQNIEVSAKLYKPLPAKNFGETDYRLYLMAKNIHATAYAKSKDLKTFNITSSNINPFDAAEKIRRHLSSALTKNLDSNTEGLVNGTLTGNTDNLSADIKDNFRICGLSHIVAVSGFNLSLIAMLITYLFSALKMKNSPASKLLSIAFIWFFTIFTGASLSVTRAAIILTVFILAEVFRRQSDVFSSLGCAILIILIANPAAFYDVGFRLSCASTLSILIFCTPIDKLLSKFLPRYFSSLIAVTLAAQIGVYPLLAFHFNSLPFLGLTANILVVPVVPFIMAIGALVWIFGFSALISGFLGTVLNYICNAVFFIVGLTARLPLASISCPSPSTTGFIIYFGVMLAFYLYLSKEKYYSALVIKLSVALFLLSFIFSSYTGICVAFLNTGNSDCAVIKGPAAIQ